VVLEYLAPEMRPAGNFVYPARGVELAETSIAVSLEQTGELLELGLGMDAAAVGGEVVPDQCGTCAA
jgi:hypothetical protein|tara:strand:+ start:93936 stop:94136 length:201 start_codon:yes stop_codon:yes gene_type:complete